MDDSIHKPGLYKWKRQTPTRLYSRSQNITTKDDIKDWIKKVEDATNTAAKATFGDRSVYGRGGGRYAALQSVQQLHEHDEIHSEAEELLTQWMNEKVILNDDIDIDDEYWPRIKARSEVKLEWDHLLADNTEELTHSDSHVMNTTAENLFDFDNLDETSAVDSILHRMLNKQVVHKEFLNDLGLDETSKRKDPRLKMELRHQQVRENRERREKELVKKRQALREKKEVNSKAKQILMKEEREKEMRAKHEEMEIKREMARIRKQMQEERRKMEDEALRVKTEKWEKENTAVSEIQKKIFEEKKQQMLKYLEEEEKERVMLKKLEEFQAKKAAKNVFIMQQHFSAWYKIVLEKRLRVGKARAVSDWKTLLRAWNAWRSYVRSKQVDFETRQHEQNIVEINRKKQRAVKHHTQTVLRKHWEAWLLYVHQEQEKQRLEEEQSKTRSKMLALLQAAQTGRLWNENKVDDTPEKKQETARSTTSTQEKINELFEDKKRPRSQISHIPREAWQVTKRHVNMTTEELAALGGGDNTIPRVHSDLEIRRRFGKQPWMNSPYIVNNFEHRYTTQQKMLHEQQKQIKEQQKLLQELQYNQRNQLLKQQAEEQHAFTEQLSEKPVSEFQPLSTGRSTTDRQTTDRQSTDRQNNPNLVVSDAAVVEQQLNNMFDKRQQQLGRLESQQHNVVAKDKETNITLDTTRSRNRGALSSGVGFQTARSDLSSRSGVSSNTSSNKYLKVLKNMEERAAERARQKAEREAKRKKAEQEKMEMLAAHEEELRRQAEEEKRARVEAYKEKKRLEKQREIEKQQQLERMQEMNKLAESHYLKSILKYRGVFPFKKLVQMSREADKRAEEHHRTALKRKVFLAWHKHAASTMEEKVKLANEMHKFLLLKHSVDQWKKHKHCMNIMEKKSQCFYKKSLLYKTVTAWAQYTMDEKIASWEKGRTAKEHYLRSLQKKTFQAWRRLPYELEKEKEREKRRIEMMKKVQMLIPDYEGVVDKSVDIS